MPNADLDFSSPQFEELKFRLIGPHRGGRVVAVAGDRLNRSVFYFGACSGGVWKTYDGGTYWEPVSDGFFNSASIGAIAVSHSDPNVVYVGTGESCVRGNVSPGDGVYRSDDGGKTWRHLGLVETRHISRVRIDPKNPEVVFVAALGDIFGSSEERGIYRSKDGGASWDRVLFRSPGAGAADLWMDPASPRTLYAALWEAQRTPWSMLSGGKDSSIYRSTDGGDTWEELSTKPGIPKGIKGRIGICSSPARPERVWALIEAKEDKGGLYASEDRGETWEQISQDRGIQGRPWYYSHIVPDPKDPDKLYSLNFQMWRTSDGGRTWTEIPTPHGDNHDLWIDPEDPLRMIEGNDGGACVSYNGAETFSTIYNQPTAQFYHVAVDTNFPYRVAGTQQDNSAISVPSRTRKGSVPLSDCYSVGHSESGHIAIDPTNPDVVFSGAVGSSPGGGGALLRYDHDTAQIRNVSVWPEYFFGEGPKVLKHRFAWTYPILFSPHDPSVLYVGGDCVFRSSDHGSSWEAISEDLTRADPEKLEASGGPITKDTSGAEHYCTVFAIGESPLRKGFLWAGTDDGLVHVSQDAGGTWQEVTPPDLGEWALICAIEPSPYEAATAYLAATRYKLRDRTPYLYKTTDLGKSWQRITSGIPADDFTRVIRSDPVRKGLLFSGTETRIYVSFDEGESWTPLSLNLPVVPIYDLLIKDDDLVVATHGRSFWILDDITPLRELDRMSDGAVHLFTPGTTGRFWTYYGQVPTQVINRKRYSTAAAGVAFRERKKPDGRKERTYLDAGTSRPDGVPISYFVDEDLKHDEIELTILDPNGRRIASFTPESAKEEEEEEPWERGDEPPPAEGEGDEAAPVAQPELETHRKREWEILPRVRGFNRFWWDMRHEGAPTTPDEKGESGRTAGPIVPPGSYSARLRVKDREVAVGFEIVSDPRLTTTQTELEEQFEMLMAIRDLQARVTGAIKRVRAIRNQTDLWKDRKDVDEGITSSAAEISKRLSTLEERLTSPKRKHDADRLKIPGGLDSKLADLTFLVGGADVAPTRQAREVFEKIKGLTTEALGDLETLIGEDLTRLSGQIRASSALVIDIVSPEGADLAAAAAAGEKEEE